MRILKSEKGQALPLVMIAITIGALVIPSFLSNAGTSLIGSRHFTNEMITQYACDAGVEHAIWNVAYGGLTANISSAGDTVSYTLPEAVNGLTTNVTVSNGWEIIAEDDFESGSFSGGSGWLNDWSHLGDTSVTTLGTPYEGSYHLRFRDDTSYAERTVDLSTEINARLQFQAKANSFEGDDEVLFNVSNNGIDWITAASWYDGDDDNQYHDYDIDLTSYNLTSEFHIAFESNVSSVADYFYVDAIEIKWLCTEYGTIASDNFESGNWAGGSGWLDDWNHTGDSVVTVNGTPYAGSYHLRLQDSTGNVSRSVDLSGQSSVHLQFYAKCDSFQPGSEAYCMVSSNGTDWDTVYTWDISYDDGQYHYYDIDLTGYELTSEFWISFQSNLFNAWDYFYVDNLVITGIQGYGITSVADDIMVKAVMELDGSTPGVVYWHMQKTG